jgi:methionyl-tRNA synthetase
VAQGRPGPFDAAAAGLVEEVKAKGASVEALYRSLDFAGAVRTVVEMGSVANKYLQDTAPWDVAKTDPERARAILTTALWVGKSCVALLKPVVPGVAEKLEAILKLPSAFTFQNALAPLAVDVAIGAYDRLFERLDLAKVKSVVKPAEVAPAASAKPEQKAPAKKAPPKEEAPPAEIAIDDFLKVDLRAARVLQAVAVEGSDKLIAVKLDVGPLGTKDIFAGLRPHVAPEALVGRVVVVVANLAPRKMKVGTSHGMMLAAGEVPVPLFVDGATPGDRIR